MEMSAFLRGSSRSSPKSSCSRRPPRPCSSIFSAGAGGPAAAGWVSLAGMAGGRRGPGLGAALRRRLFTPEA